MTPLVRNVAGLVDAALDHGIDSEAVRLRTPALRGFAAEPRPESVDLALRALQQWSRAGDGPTAGRWRAVVVALRDLLREGAA